MDCWYRKFDADRLYNYLLDKIELVLAGYLGWRCARPRITGLLTAWARYLPFDEIKQTRIFILSKDNNEPSKMQVYQK